jgi:hypothetical protein
MIGNLIMSTIKPTIKLKPKKLDVKLELKVPVEYCRLKDYPNYAVSNYGDVLNIRTQKYLKPHTINMGYLTVALYNARITKSKRVLVHRLVAQCFLDNPDNLPQVDHIDRERKSNRVANLRWVTNGENQLNRTKRDVNNSGASSSSRFTGVHRRSNRWIATIFINPVTVYIGIYPSEVEAGLAFNKYIDEHQLNKQKNEILIPST